MSISLSTYCNPGSQYTIAFQPTGMGNPFDSSNNWYNAGSLIPQITVNNVNMNGGIFSTNEIDVTFIYDGDGTDTLASIGGDFTNQLNSTLWGYQTIGAAAGSGNPTPSSNNTGLGALGNDVKNLANTTSSWVWWLAGGILAIGLAFAYTKREV